MVLGQERTVDNALTMANKVFNWHKGIVQRILEMQIVFLIKYLTLSMFLFLKSSE